MFVKNKSLCQFNYCTCSRHKFQKTLQGDNIVQNIDCAIRLLSLISISIYLWRAQSRYLDDMLVEQTSHFALKNNNVPSNLSRKVDLTTSKDKFKKKCCENTIVYVSCIYNCSY